MHPPLKKALIEALDQVINNSEYSDKVYARTVKSHRKFGSRDRRQLAEALYDMVRAWRRISFPEKSIEQALATYLEEGSQPTDSRMSWAEKLSVNDELYLVMTEELGDERARALLESMDLQAEVFLRPNTLKTDLKALEDALVSEDFLVEPVNEPSACLKLSERKNLFQSKAFSSGLFEVQDAGSQALVPLLNPEPGERVVDACAGAGGKTLQMAAMMQNKGRIIAMDVHQWKLDELRKRARRAGAHIIETKCIESSKTVKRLQGTADKLLLDVPCTGTGVIKRKPDTKLKYSKEEHEALLELQENILESYAKMLRPGGKLLYATCSVLPSENEAQIKKFLAKDPKNYTVEKILNISPTDYNSDAFFAALIVKQN